MIALISLGCPKALVDSEKIITGLSRLGYVTSDNCERADLVIINTCGFINDAIDESYSTIANAIQDNGKVIVTGCLGARKEEVLRHFPQILEVTGPNSAETVIAAVQKHLPILRSSKSLESIQRDINDIKLTPPHYAYIKIAEGCNQSCSYCIIPQLRGKLVSRPLKEIMLEAEGLVNSGVKELLIISQDTGAYGSDFAKGNANFFTLINELSELPAWVRLHYLYPYPYIDEVLPLMATGKILPYLDIPLQHASAKILRAMRRPASSENMLKRIEKWRDMCPDIAIRSTFIVGFPGETEADFAELLEFLEIAQLDRVGCFKYSQVAGAPANDFPDQVAEEIKEERYHRFMQAQQKISAKKMQAKIGSSQQVIVDTIEKNRAICRGFADSPEIDGLVYVDNCVNVKPGEFLQVKIIAADNYDLYAEIGRLG